MHRSPPVSHASRRWRWWPSSRRPGGREAAPPFCRARPARSRSPSRDCASAPTRSRHPRAGRRGTCSRGPPPVAARCAPRTLTGVQRARTPPYRPPLSRRRNHWRGPSREDARSWRHCSRVMRRPRPIVASSAIRPVGGAPIAGPVRLSLRRTDRRASRARGLSRKLTAGRPLPRQESPSRDGRNR